MALLVCHELFKPDQPGITAFQAGSEVVLLILIAPTKSQQSCCKDQTKTRTNVHLAVGTLILIIAASNLKLTIFIAALIYEFLKILVTISAFLSLLDLTYS